MRIFSESEAPDVVGKSFVTADFVHILFTPYLFHILIRQT